MNIKNKEFFFLMIIMFASFPAILGVILIATGTIRLELGLKGHPVVIERKAEQAKITARTDSIMTANSKTLEAIQSERSNLEQEKQQISQQQQGLAVYQHDLDSRKQELDNERQGIESLVAKNDSATVKKMRQLSKIYASMRAPEAAQIIATLPEETAAGILDGIKDDRQKAKIISALPAERAASLTQYLGGVRRAKQDIAVAN